MEALPNELLLHIVLNSNRSISKDVICSLNDDWKTFLMKVGKIFELNAETLTLFNNFGAEIDDFLYIDDGDTIFLCREANETIYHIPTKIPNQRAFFSYTHLISFSSSSMDK